MFSSQLSGSSVAASVAVSSAISNQVYLLVCSFVDAGVVVSVSLNCAHLRSAGRLAAHLIIGVNVLGEQINRQV